MIAISDHVDRPQCWGQESIGNGMQQDARKPAKPEREQDEEQDEVLRWTHIPEPKNALQKVIKARVAKV